MLSQVGSASVELRQLTSKPAILKSAPLKIFQRLNFVLLNQNDFGEFIPKGRDEDIE